MQAMAAEKYPGGGEGMDLSLARQRFYAPALLSPEAQFLVSSGCENGFPNSSGPGPAAPRPAGFKSLSSRAGGGPAAPLAHTAFMSPHSGIGYYNLNRALEMKSPPPSPLPLNMGSENLRGDAANQAMAASRANQSSARGVLYQGLHSSSSSSMVAMGKAGLLGPSLGGYGLPSPGAAEYSQPGFYHSVSLQRGAVNPWQQAQPQDSNGLHMSPGMSTGGCSFSSQSCSSTSPQMPSLNLSIKLERSSPEHTSCSPVSPPLHHLRQHSPMSNPDSARRTPPAARRPNETKDFPKARYLQDEEDGGQPLRQLEISDGWQR
ncbi:hypothetical protein EYF80_050431 [Liparis tanakae]|uniref:Myocyte-specific enhancer factor 2C n=1 Tax=Liparis tanakae TaxID=230148 RepID=A0A4Z2FES5_9TELE|nr:hypothetical protein EYF80_050431 [Liparis tanakae]